MEHAVKYGHFDIREIVYQDILFLVMDAVETAGVLREDPAP